MTFTVPDGVVLGAVAEGVFYGVYIILFILYLVLRHRNGYAVGRLLTLAHILLFVLCTLFFCLDISGDYLFVVPDAFNDGAIAKVSVGSGAVFYLIDYLAQMILLYRCWIIWDRRWAVVVLPGFLMLVSLGVGLAWDALVKSFSHTTLTAALAIVTLSISLGVNALTTSLIVFKILSISRDVRRTGFNSHRSLRIATAMLIESGLLIFASQVIYMTLFSISVPGPESDTEAAFTFAQGAITHVYGIAPTLLNIRVIMGSAYDSTTGEASSMKFAHSGVTIQTVNTSMTTAGVQTWGIDIEHDGDSDNHRAAGNTA